MKMLLYFTVGRMYNGISKEGLLYMLVRMRSPARSGISLACQCQKSGDASSYTARSDDEIIHGEKSYKEKQARSA